MLKLDTVRVKLLRMTISNLKTLYSKVKGGTNTEGI